MFFNKLYSKAKRILSLSTAVILAFSSLSMSLLWSVPVSAQEASTNATDTSTSTLKFPNIDLQVEVSDYFVCFTQYVTSNNAYLERIGAENAEGLRNSMIAANIYLEAIPKESETVNYEIIIVGDKLASTDITDLGTLSDDELDKLLADYTSGINKKTDKVEETLINSDIKTIGDATFFYTDITSTSETNVTVLLRKYYTIKNGYYYTFSLQTTDKTVDPDIEDKFVDIIESAQYKEISAGIFGNPIISEVFSIFVTSVAPIAILGIILFISIRMTTKKKPKA